MWADAQGSTEGCGVCCEAAFTGELLDEFKHSNIGDNHICNGVMKKGYSCKANTGGFVWGKSKWKFMRKADYPTEANGWNMGFYSKESFINVINTGLCEEQIEDSSISFDAIRKYLVGYYSTYI